MSELLRLAELSERRESLDGEWRELIVSLVGSGVSLRTVADAAGVSHMTVRKIYRETVS